jgi:hypothetical protein
MVTFIEKHQKMSYDKFLVLFCLDSISLGMTIKKLAKLVNDNNTTGNNIEKQNNDKEILHDKSEVANTTFGVAKTYYCNVCDYNTNRKYNYDIHLSSVKHKKNQAKTTYKYNCDICEYHTNNKYNYDKHIYSVKHKHKCNIGNNQTEKEEICKIKDIDKMKNSDLFVSIMSEIKTMMKEQNQTIMNTVVNNPTIVNNNNNTNNQTNNQQFNLNMFLNETCKDAMNLSDFIENMQVSMEDMEKTGELGFAKGMSRIIMNNLNAIDVCKRPIHCSDVKRETLYVKNNGVWEKETDERKRTKEIIYKVSSLNLKHLLKWRDLPRNKGYDKSDHVKNDEFTNLVIEINKMREEEFDKIITSVSKHVAIDKEKVKMSGYLNY